MRTMRGSWIRRGAVTIAALVAAVLGAWQAAQAAVVANYPTFASVAGLALNGDAQQLNDTIRLSDADFESNSSVFTRQRVLDLERSFVSKFRYYSNEAEDVPSVGFAFLVHGEGKGALGEGAEGLGYAGLRPSVAVEFDMTPDKTVLTGHHVAIVKNGKAGSPPEAADFPVYSNPFRGRVVYKAKHHRVALYAATEGEPMPESPLVSRRLNLERLIGKRARAGFTGSAYLGGSTQELRSWKLQQP